MNGNQFSSTLLLLFVCVSINLFGQSYIRLQQTWGDLQRISLLTDSAQRAAGAEKWLSALKDSNAIPFVDEDSVLFLFQGNVKSVVWMGDFNGWGHDEAFKNRGRKVANTSIWYLKCAFPKDARLDYKIVINGSEYLLDPNNPHQQWSGVGGGSPNSELRMPLWKEDPEQQVHAGISKGTLKSDLLFNSKVLGYQITYSVYLPYGYENLGKMPAVYVTDGYEYLHPQLGNMVTVLDNLIGEKKNQTRGGHLHRPPRTGESLEQQAHAGVGNEQNLP